MNKFLKTIYFIIFCITAGTLVSCRDDFDFGYYEPVPEGERATISIKIAVPSMAVYTRDAGIDPDSDEASAIHDLWVGVFSKATGLKTGEVFQTKSEIIKDHSTREITIENVDVLSGESYIVAVANMQGFRGLDTEEGEQLSDIQKLIRETQSWEEYKRIGGIMSNPLSTQRMGNIFMSGNYSEHSEDGIDILDAKNNPPSVAIRPGVNNLSGTIHLKRVVAYNKFVLIPHHAITFTPVSWQVMNVPGMSYIHNRENGNLNASDNRMNEGVTFWTGKDDDGKDLNSSFYHNSVESTDFDNVFETEYYKDNYIIDSSFDFYLLENKHTGIINLNDLTEEDRSNPYNAREREHKQVNGRNTGWYSSLVSKTGPIPASPSTDSDLKNNNATFVVLKANLDYYYEAKDESRTPVVPPQGADLVKDYIHRFAEVTYTIHLGYCEGEGINKANDFNCRRNSYYTYRILIGGAGSIRVEVQNNSEPQPGMEGTVTDVMTNFIDLDAHYGVFNIALSDRQRKNLLWRIIAPYENDVVDMISGSHNDKLTTNSGIYLVDKNQNMNDALPENQFYNWVQIRPTTSEGVLAHYPGDPRLIGRGNIGDYPTKEKTGTGGSDGTIYNYAQNPEDKGVWYLETFKDAAGFPHTDSYKNLNDAQIQAYKKFLSTKFSFRTDEEVAFNDLDSVTQAALERKHYYTIFIDEYVYEYQKVETKPSLTGDFMQVDRNSAAWRTYVNNDNRRLWLSLSDLEISNDFESAYSNSIYLISQRSIQTYYNSSAERALGLEHINETFLNEAVQHWNWNWQEGDDQKDGLLNLYRYFQSDWRKSWYEIWKDESGNFINNSGTSPGNYDEWKQQPAYGYDPNNIGEQLLRYVPATINQEILMPMVRNRDLNNNNIIEPYEMRWYLPSAETYTRMSLGAASLVTPLFQPKNFPRNAITAGLGTLTSHYITSDLKMFWAEELASVSGWDWGPANVVRSGNMRCVRNLGQELYLEPGSDPYKEGAIVSPAYTLEENNIVHMKFYRSGALRSEITSQPIPVHSVTDLESLPTRKFQYYTEAFRVDNVFVYEENNQRKNFSNWWNMVENFPSEKGLPGWRVPNISELATLLYLGVLDDDKRYISCTYEYFNNRNEQGAYAPQYHFILGVEEGKVTADMKANDGSYILLVRDIE